MELNFIKVNRGHYSFFININYIVSLYTWKAVNNYIHYCIYYYDQYKNLVSGDISENDYKKIVGDLVE